MVGQWARRGKNREGREGMGKCLGGEEVGGRQNRGGGRDTSKSNSLACSFPIPSPNFPTPVKCLEIHWGCGGLAERGDLHD